uniref:Neuromedin-K n=1 Tax=Takifugu rubripes TaxID=31033 RepID=A0A3B5K6T0_TAKRU
MEKTSSRRSPSRLATFVVFLLSFNALMSQLKPEPSVSGGVVKKLDGIDYDSFVGLMGRRNAAEANKKKKQIKEHKTLKLCPYIGSHMQVLYTYKLRFFRLSWSHLRSSTLRDLF